MNLSQSLLHALKSHGARQIFGIPGDFALPFFKQIETSGILPLYTLSHEPAVGFAADAAARIQGSLGVAAVTYGAGALNMVNAVASAYAEKSPLVVLSGGPGAGESASGLLLHHQVKRLDSQLRIFEEITCDQAILNDPERAPVEIARVLMNAKRHQRPVYIEIPRDAVEWPCAPVVPMAPPPFDPDALAACADEVLARLAAAQRPAVMVDVEVRRYGLEDKVAELTRRLGYPVATCFMGRGLLAHSDAPLVGTYMGVAGDPAVTELIEHADGLLLLGVILSDTNFAASQKKIDLRHSIIACDEQVRVGHHVYPHVPLTALVDALLARVPAPAPTLGATVPTLGATALTGSPAPQHQHGFAQDFPHGLVADDSTMTPAAIATGLNDLFAQHGVMPIASDVGDCLFTAMDIVPTDFTAPGYYATMGYGVPAGLGLQAATGRRPVILVGDGAFQMTGWELGNCRRYGWDPIVIVLNNCSWEMLRTFQPESQFNDLGDWGFASCAAGLGGQGVRVKTVAEWQAALAHAAATRGQFQLIEVMLPRGVLSQTLQRFVAGVKRLTQATATVVA